MPAKRGLEVRKKVTSGIMGLTRPRFGKRSGDWGRPSPGGWMRPSDLMSPTTKALLRYLTNVNNVTRGYV